MAQVLGELAFLRFDQNLFLTKSFGELVVYGYDEPLIQELTKYVGDPTGSKGKFGYFYPVSHHSLKHAVRSEACCTCTIFRLATLVLARLIFFLNWHYSENTTTVYCTNYLIFTAFSLRAQSLSSLMHPSTITYSNHSLLDLHEFGIIV